MSVNADQLFAPPRAHTDTNPVPVRTVRTRKLTLENPPAESNSHYYVVAFHVWDLSSGGSSASQREWRRASGEREQQSRTRGRRSGGEGGNEARRVSRSLIGAVSCQSTGAEAGPKCKGITEAELYTDPRSDVADRPPAVLFSTFTSQPSNVQEILIHIILKDIDIHVRLLLLLLL